ncbi:glycoside hydrolase family 25 protein, partial [Piedraia hortae CBS 480.64]
DFEAIKRLCAHFVLIRANRGIGSPNPCFENLLAGARAADLYHGAYHFGNRINDPMDEVQDFVYNHGGLWVDNGLTLPAVLDLKRDLSEECSKITVDWIRRWSDQMNR